ncbi:MAG: hypothetical protein KatS3mg114_0483 [Planctomycetaceae bacterium]|nr:MAG: hypothetical protein KatS3mg114_0483 [Planctomycetaceae bacterium]
MSPGRITVQGMMPEIFLPGPARPRIAPARMLSRVAHWESDRADSSVCGSSITTRRRPHRLAVGPLVLHAANAPGDPGDLDDRSAGTASGDRGQDNSRGRSSRCVSARPCRAGRCSGSRSRRGTGSGNATSGKSSSNSSLPSSSILIESSMSIACPSSEPIRQTNSRCPYSTAQMQAHSQMVVLPLPRGIAIANRPPRNTACSIRGDDLQMVG